MIAATPRRALGEGTSASSAQLIGGDAVDAMLLAAGLGSLVVARWAATVGGVAGALPIGLAFGAGLLALVLASRREPARVAAPPRTTEVLAGLLGGLALTALTGPALGMSGGAGFAPWATVTTLVAIAEELVLRGSLFGAILRARGPGVAVGITTVIFALMHVSLYGWHVVPLDLAVGLWLAGLRLTTRGVAAPAIAHIVADLATWWL